jgi:hypothetical protein
MLTGGCGAPVAVVGASYGADGASLVGSGKTTTDHFISMVSKKDCAIWRIVRNQSICRELEGDPNPYHVNYDEPFRQVGESGVEYAPALHSPADAPPASWSSAAYQPAPQSPAPAPVTATAQAPLPAVQPEPLPPPTPEVAPATPTKENAGHSPAKKKKKAVKKPAPNPAAPTP